MLPTSHAEVATEIACMQTNLDALLYLALLPCLMASGSATTLPFAFGERLTYSARAGPGMNGHGEMWIAGPMDVHGTAAMILHSEITGGFGPFRVSDKTTSWIDPDRMMTLRFTKSEHNPLGRHEEDVEIDPATHGWRSADGRTGTSTSDQPLDELSFIYALRSLNIPDNGALVLNRHFDAERNPTVLRSLGRSTVTTPTGTYQVRDIEMRVRDARRYRGEGVLRISLSDDPCRRPVRIESTIPNAGTIVLTLTAAEPAVAGCAAH